MVDVDEQIEGFCAALDVGVGCLFLDGSIEFFVGCFDVMKAEVSHCLPAFVLFFKFCFVHDLISLVVGI